MPDRLTKAMCLGALQGEMESYFRALQSEDPDASHYRQMEAIWTEMDNVAAEHPGSNANALKARLHEVIATRFEPVIFRHSPFYFEMGLRSAFNWGVGRGRSVGMWLKHRRTASHVDPTANRNLGYFREARICSGEVFDDDHHGCVATAVDELKTRLLQLGLHPIRRRLCLLADQRDFHVFSLTFSQVDCVDVNILGSDAVPAHRHPDGVVPVLERIPAAPGDRLPQARLREPNVIVSREPRQRRELLVEDLDLDGATRLRL